MSDEPIEKPDGGPPAGDPPKTDPTPDVRTLKVNGKDLEMPVGEVDAAAQKWLADQQSMERNKKTEKDHAEDLAIAKAFRGAQTGNMDDYRRLMKLGGSSDDDVDKAVAAYTELTSDDSTAEETGNSGTPAPLDEASVLKVLGTSKAELGQALSFVRELRAKNLDPGKVGEILGSTVNTESDKITRGYLKNVLSKDLTVQRLAAIGGDISQVVEIAMPLLTGRSKPGLALTDEDFTVAARQAIAAVKKMVPERLLSGPPTSLGSLGGDAGIAVLPAGQADKRPDINDQAAYAEWTLRDLAAKVSAAE